MKKVTIILCLSLWACSCAMAQSQASQKKRRQSLRSSQHPKKGICLTTKKNNQDSWKANVEAVRAGWHYSWGAKLPEEEPEGVEFVPMIWGYWGTNDGFLSKIEELTAAKPADSQKHLLGFNEPDGKGQANLSVERALEAWPYLMKTGRRLGSPATVHPDNEWMREFMKQAEEKKYRVDFVCVHWYGPPNAKGFVKHLKKIHKMYDKPIWITEFAVGDWKAKSRQENRHSPEVVLEFLEELLPKLDKLDFVERYAWFPAGENNSALGTSALFKEDGSLTPLGQFYASHKYRKRR